MSRLLSNQQSPFIECYINLPINLIFTLTHTHILLVTVRARTQRMEVSHFFFSLFICGCGGCIKQKLLL